MTFFSDTLLLANSLARPRLRSQFRKASLPAGPTGDRMAAAGSCQHKPLRTGGERVHTVARERYNWVQLCILSATPHGDV